MAIYAIDSNVIVAALLDWHENHDRARTALEKALRSNTIVLPIHALIESYSVMTRLPAPFRLDANSARTVLERTFRNRAKLARLRSRSCWPWLDAAADRNVAGGRIYDSLILESAKVSAE